MTDIFLKAVNMSISAGWLVLVVLGLRLVLKSSPKWIHVLLWGIVAIRLICPFSIESALSLIPSSETISPEIMMDWTPEINTGVELLDQVVNPVITESFAPEPMASANPLQIWIPVAANIWLLGVLVMLAYTVVSYISLRWKLRTAVILEENIFQSEAVSSPFVLGLLQPRIYLPYAIEGQNLYHVVAHERSHICRKDHWWKCFGFLLLSVYWFHPLMWIAYLFLCRDIEFACDEKVIANLANSHRAEYTEALVACSVKHLRVAACPLAFGEVGVKERVRSILNYRKPAFWVIVTALVMCVVVAVCFLTDPVKKTGSVSYMTVYHTVAADTDEIVFLTEKSYFADGTITVCAEYESKSILELTLRQENNPSESVSFPIISGETVVLEVEGETWYELGVHLVNNSDNIVDVTITYYDASWSEYGISGLAMDITDPISFEDLDFQDNDLEITLRNLHNGEDTYISDPDSVKDILAFLSQVKGTFPTSSRGYYGGCYEFQIINGNKIMFSIGFGDDGYFNYGDFGDGYPARYKLQGMTREQVILFLQQYDQSGYIWEIPLVTLQATLVEIHDGYYLVEPVAGSWELNSASRIQVPINNMKPSPEPQVGDVLWIEYDGQIMETYPAQISNVYGIRVDSGVQEVTVSLTVDKRELPDSIYQESGHQFGENEVVVYSNGRTSIWLYKVMPANESEDQLYFMFDISYDAGESGDVLSSYRQIGDHTVQPYLYLASKDLTSSNGVFEDALSIRGHGPGNQFAFYVSKEACIQAQGVLKIDVVCIQNPQVAG